MNRQSPALTPGSPLRNPASRSSIVPRTTGSDSGGPTAPARATRIVR